VRLKSDNTEIARALGISRQESDVLAKRLDEREFEFHRLSRHSSETSNEICRRDTTIVSLQDQLKSASGESLELARANQLLMMEIDQLRDRLGALMRNQEGHKGEFEGVCDRLRVTERERDDILAMYKQVINENRNFSNAIVSSSHKTQDGKSRDDLIMAVAECEVLRERLAERQVEIDGLRKALEAMTVMKKTQNPDDHQLERIRAAMGKETEKNRKLEKEIVELRKKLQESTATVPTTSVADLEKTVEQQYALIGEMDSEQARLIVENSRLREQLAVRHSS
jgi:regulator of replication initiation timing